MTLPSPPEHAADPDGPRADAVVAGRYRLVGPRSTGSGTTLWRAVDEVLGRTVAVKSFRTGSEAAVPAEVLAAVARAGEVSDALFVRLLDVHVPDGGGYGYLVSEWVEAPTLAALLRGGPLPAPEAVAVVAEVARGLVAAAAADVFHGALHPGNVFVTADGSVRVSDLEVAATIRRDWSDQPAAEDALALGALLYAATTATWPHPGRSALPAAPAADGRPMSPRQVNAAVPREVDAAAVRLLGPAGAPVTAAGVEQALTGLPRRRPGTTAPAAARRPARWPRLLAGRVVPAAALVVVALVGWHEGSSLGKVPGQRLERPTAGSGSPRATAPPSPGTVPLKVVSVQDVDPQGDGREDHADVGAVIDGDTTTSWQTDRYQSNPRFGGLKSGLGLLLDLGRPQRVRAVRILFTVAGAAVEIHAGDSPKLRADATPALAQAADSPQTVTLHVDAPAARYWLVWITALPPDGTGGYKEGISELTLLS